MAPGSTFEYHANFGNDQACYQCHSSSLLEIHPLASQAEDLGSVWGTLGPTPATWLANLNQYFATDIADLNAAMRSHNANRNVVHAPVRAGNLADFPNASNDPSA